MGSVKRVSESPSSSGSSAFSADAPPAEISPPADTSPTAGAPSDGASTSAEGDGKAAKRRRWRRTRARIRLVRNRVHALPGGRAIFRVGIGVLGGLIVVLGLVLVPLPGPGWAIVFGGLAIWAIEFSWAARLLNWVRARVRAFTRMMKRLHWTLRAALSLAVAAVLLAIAWLWVGHRYGFDTLSRFWDYITTH